MAIFLNSGRRLTWLHADVLWPQHSPWRPSCLPPCARPAASWAGSTRSPARWRSPVAPRRRPAPDPPCGRLGKASGQSLCPRLYRFKSSWEPDRYTNRQTAENVIIHTDARTDEASGRGVLKVVVFGEQRDNLGEDGLAHQLPFVVLGHDARPHLDLLAHLQTARTVNALLRTTRDFFIGPRSVSPWGRPWGYSRPPRRLSGHPLHSQVCWRQMIWWLLRGERSMSHWGLK